MRSPEIGPKRFNGKSIIKRPLTLGNPLKLPRVLLVSPIDASFVREDSRLLEEFCDVAPFQFRDWRDYPRLAREVSRCDLVFCWFATEFAGVVAVLARILGRGLVLVSGGWDISRMPEIGYGSLLRMRGRVAARISLRLADRVLSFSDWSADAIRRLVPRSNVHRVYLGVDTDRFRPSRKENLVVSVAHVSRENLARKGLVTFVKAASLVPDAHFCLIGHNWDDAVEHLAALTSQNVEFTGWLPDEELRAMLARAKVYVQASFSEGFGLALAEAMSAECVPVVTRVGAIPEVVGDTGFYFPYGDECALAEAIRAALHSTKGSLARERIQLQFTIENRLRELRDAVYGAWRVPQVDSRRSLGSHAAVERGPR